jgi:hypothetical protein
MTGYTKSFRALLERADVRRQSTIVRLATTLLTPGRHDRQYFTDAQWAADRRCTRRSREADRRRALAIDYAIETRDVLPATGDDIAALPLAPRGWRPKGMPKGMTVEAWRARQSRKARRGAR